MTTLSFRQGENCSLEAVGGTIFPEYQTAFVGPNEPVNVFCVQFFTTKML